VIKRHRESRDDIVRRGHRRGQRREATIRRRRRDAVAA